MSTVANQRPAGDASVRTGCGRCGKVRFATSVGGRMLCGECIGQRKPTELKRLVPVDLGPTPANLQIAVGRVMWRVPWVDLQISVGDARMMVPEDYVDRVLAPEGWEPDGTTSRDGRVLLIWRLGIENVHPSSPAPVASEPDVAAVEEPDATPDDPPLSPLAGTVLALHDDDMRAVKGLGALKELHPDKGGLGSISGGEYRPWTLTAPVPADDPRLAAVLARAQKMGALAHRFDGATWVSALAELGKMGEAALVRPTPAPRTAKTSKRKAA